MQQTSPETISSPLERKIDLSFPLKQIESEIETRLKKIARTAKFPGFRPGKAPLKFVAQQYGGQVRQEVIGDSLQKGFSDSVREKNLRVAGYPKIEPKELAAGANDNLEFVATFEVYPEVQAGELGSESIKRPITEITDADIDRTIDVLRKQRRHFHKVERAAQNGDQISLDFEGKIDGKLFDGGKAEKYVLVLGEGQFLPDFEANVVGLKSGDAKSFELTFPEDYHSKDLAGKTVTFDLKIHEVAEPHLPELTSEFAEGLGISGGDLEKLRSEIKINLEREVKKRIQARLKEQAMQALINKSTLTVPKSLVEIEIERLAENAMSDLKARGIGDKKLSLPPQLFEAQAERRVRLGLILAEIVKQHSLQAKPEQIKAIIEEHAQSFEQPEQVVRWYYSDRERLSEIETVVLEDNVVAWVVERSATENVPTSCQELMEAPK